MDVEVARSAVDLLQQLVGRHIGDPDHPVLIRLLASTSTAGAAGRRSMCRAGHHRRLGRIAGRAGRQRRRDLRRVRRGHPLRRRVRRRVYAGDEFADAEFDRRDAAGPGQAPSSSSAPRPAHRFRTTRPNNSPGPPPRCAAAGYPPAPVAPVGVRGCRTTCRSPSTCRRCGSGRPKASGHGVAESRDPNTGGFAPTGTFRRGVRRSATDDRPGESLDALPGGRDLLTSALRTLELHLKGAARVEFEIRDGELSLLAASKVERPAPRTAVRLAVDLAEAGAVDDQAAVGSVRASDLESLLHPQLQLTGQEIVFGRGLPAAAGAAVGRIALSSDRAVELSDAGDPVVLVADETSPGDLPGMLAAKAIVTSRGGLAAHAAVVARGLGRPAVCGATGVRIDLANRTITSDGHALAEGELISVDGSGGILYTGTVHVVPPRPGGDLDALLTARRRIAPAGGPRQRRQRPRRGARTAVRRRGCRPVPHRAPVPRRPAAAGAPVPARHRPGRGGGRADRPRGGAKGGLPRSAQRHRQPAGDGAVARRAAARVPRRVRARGEPDARACAGCGSR